MLYYAVMQVLLSRRCSDQMSQFLPSSAIKFRIDFNWKHVIQDFGKESSFV